LIRREKIDRRRKIEKKNSLEKQRLLLMSLTFFGIIFKNK
jgi:hypothetical protein